MFESALAVEGPALRHRVDPRLLAGALLLHAAVAVALVAASLWTIDRVGPPRATEPFWVVMSPPPLSPAPAAPRAASTANVPARMASLAPARLAPVAQPTSLESAPSATKLETPEGLSPLAPGGGPGANVVESGGDGVATAPIRVGGDVSAPEVIGRVEPAYPEAARFARKSGSVIVEAEIGEDGLVRAAHVLRALPAGFGFEESALAAVRQWRFRPATRAGRPVAVLFDLTVFFRLD